jgi:hypothetical protein
VCSGNELGTTNNELGTTEQIINKNILLEVKYNTSISANIMKVSFH